MKNLLVLLLFIFHALNAFCQIEANLSYANNGRGNAHGPGINTGYEWTLGKKWATKSQIGYKNLRITNDYLDGIAKNEIVEVHQTLSYKLIWKKNYRFTPNIGLNYRYFDWYAKINPPYNTNPIRHWYVGFKNNASINIYSTADMQVGTFRALDVGFTCQLQNQFRIADRTWLLVTPFLEDTYDGVQTVAGCYAGIRYELK